MGCFKLVIHLVIPSSKLTQNFVLGRRESVHPHALPEESTVNAACSEVFLVSWGLGRPYSLQLQALTWESGLLLLKHN